MYICVHILRNYICTHIYICIYVYYTCKYIYIYIIFYIYIYMYISCTYMFTLHSLIESELKNGASSYESSLKLLRPFFNWFLIEKCFDCISIWSGLHNHRFHWCVVDGSLQNYLFRYTNAKHNDFDMTQHWNTCYFVRPKQHIMIWGWHIMKKHMNSLDQRKP